MKKCEWKKCIDGRYLVNEYGDVRINKENSKILKWRMSGRNRDYACISYRDIENNKNAYVYVHELVTEAYISKRPDGFVVNHIDGNKKNNHFSNLEWTTYKYNSNHAVKLGLIDNYFKRNSNRKISKKNISNIKSKYLLGYSFSKLAKEYNVSRSAIQAIVSSYRTGRYERICFYTFLRG